MRHKARNQITGIREGITQKKPPEIERLKSSDLFYFLRLKFLVSFSDTNLQIILILTNFLEEILKIFLFVVQNAD